MQGLRKLLDISQVVHRSHHANYHLLMSINETFTANEIMEILTDIGVEVTYESAVDNGLNFATIDCAIGPVEFWCHLMVNEPFFESFQMCSLKLDTDNPFAFVNKYNDEPLRVSRASVRMDEDGLAELDETSQTRVMALSEVYFAGGVSKDHVKFSIQMWLEDMIDFHELVFEDENEEDELPLVPELQNLPPATLLVQITACLSGERSMTSREMGRILEADRRVINSILYKERDRFENDGAQPPRWSLK